MPALASGSWSQAGQAPDALPGRPGCSSLPHCTATPHLTLTIDMSCPQKFWAAPLSGPRCNGVIGMRRPSQVPGMSGLGWDCCLPAKGALCNFRLCQAGVSSRCSLDGESMEGWVIGHVLQLLLLVRLEAAGPQACICRQVRRLHKALQLNSRVVGLCSTPRSYIWPGVPYQA